MLEAMGSPQPSQIDPSREPFGQKILRLPPQRAAGQVNIAYVNQPNHSRIPRRKISHGSTRKRPTLSFYLCLVRVYPWLNSHSPVYEGFVQFHRLFRTKSVFALSYEVRFHALLNENFACAAEAHSPAVQITFQSPVYRHTCFHEFLS